MSELTVKKYRARDSIYLDGKCICSGVNIDYSDRLAHRWNCHDDLVAACEEILKFKDTAEDNCANDGDGCFDTWQSSELSVAFDDIKAALDKTKKQELTGERGE